MTTPPETVICPKCGNTNAWSVESCPKCKLPMGPVRALLSEQSEGDGSAEADPPIASLKPADTKSPPKAGLQKETEPAPPLPELPTRAEDEPTATYVDSSRFLIRGIGDRADEIAARFFKQVADRNIEGLKLSLGKLIIKMDELRSDSRDYYFAERVFPDDARAGMAVRIAPSGTDLFVEWRHYTTPGKVTRDKSLSQLWLGLGGGAGFFGLVLLFAPTAFGWGIVLLVLAFLLGISALAGFAEADTYRKYGLEGFQTQDSTAFQLSVRAALEEAIDLAGISKELIQEVHDDGDKNRRVI